MPWKYLLLKAQSPVSGKFSSLISQFKASTLCSHLPTGTVAGQWNGGSASAFTDVNQTSSTGANWNAFIYNRWCLAQTPFNQQIVYHRVESSTQPWKERKRPHQCMRIHGTNWIFPSDALRSLDYEGFRFNSLLSSHKIHQKILKL